MTVVPTPLPRCASQVLDHGSQAVARGAVQVLARGVQAVACGAARCALHVHGLSARPMPAVPRKYLNVVPRPFPAAPARCASQVLDCSAQAVTRDAGLVFRRYLIVTPRTLPAAPLVERRRYLVLVPRPLFTAPRRCRNRRRANRQIFS
jgi:hypothetical protein